jgi:hypothetical protein
LRTYNLTGAIVLLAYFILAPLVNYHVDPFGYWGTNRWAYYYSSEREIKRALVRRNHYDGIVMGSSKVANMHTGEILGYRVLNAAWSAGLPEEFCYFLNETDPSVRFVAIGLDLFMFNEDGFPFKEPDAYNPDRRMLDYLISPRLLRRSLQTIRKRIQGAPPRIRPDGSRNYDDGYDADKSFSDEKALQIVQTTFYDGYRFSERRLAKLREIRDHCRRKKIRPAQAGTERHLPGPRRPVRNLRGPTILPPPRPHALPSKRGPGVVWALPPATDRASRRRPACRASWEPTWQRTPASYSLMKTN